MKRSFLYAVLLATVLLTGCQNGTEGQSGTVTETSSETSAETSAETKTVKEITTVTESTAAVTTIAETKPLTPLEKEYAWLEAAQSDKYAEPAFLYDFTGDGFPERLELILEPYVLTGCISSEVYGWRDNIVNIVIGNGMYVCRDSDGKNFIVTFYSTDAMGGMTPFYAERYDFYADGIYSTFLGEADVYFNGKDYTGICNFLGEKLDSGIGKNGGEILYNRLMEYVSEYELIEEIKIKYEDGRYKAVFEAKTDFTEEYRNDFPEYAGTEPYEDKTIYINVNAPDMKKISEFSDAECVNLFGDDVGRSDLEFLKDMPSVRYIRLRFKANSVETFIPLTEMSSLEALIDENGDSCMDRLSDEDKARVRELFPEDKYFWGEVK